MQVPAPMRRLLAAIVTVSCLVQTLCVAPSAVAGPVSALCQTDGVRGTIPANFPIDACIGNNTIVVRNNLQIPVHLALSGGASKPVNVPVDQSVAAIITRAHFNDPTLLLPSDEARISLGAAAGTVTLADTNAGGFYAEAMTLSTFFPGGVAKGLYDAFTGLITELNDDLGTYYECIQGKNWIGQQACQIEEDWNVTFALGRAAALGLTKGALNLIVGTAQYLRWVAQQVPNVEKILGANGNRVISFSATPTQPPANPNPPPTERSGTGSVAVAQGPSAPIGYRYAIALGGWPANDSVPIT
jgi:hypothetical protein